jgi:hypothetical protein
VVGFRFGLDERPRDRSAQDAGAKARCYILGAGRGPEGPLFHVTARSEGLSAGVLASFTESQYLRRREAL